MSLNAVRSDAQGRLGAVVEKRMELATTPLSLHVGSILLVVLASLAAIGGVFTLTQSLEIGILLLIASVLLGAAGGFFLMRRAALRGAFTLHEKGLVLSRRNTDQALAFTQVEHFTLLEKSMLNNGKHAGLLRTLTLAWAGGEVRFAQFAAPDTDDAFAPLLSQLLRQLADSAEMKLKAGASLRGTDWALDSHGLSLKGQAHVRLKDLAGVGSFENRVSFWRPGEELPFFSVPEASPNARLLGMLAQRQMAERERPMAGPLGRVLFQRKMSTGSKVFSWGVVACLILGGLTMAITQGLEHHWSNALLFPFIAWGLAALLGIYTLGSFRVHELGVAQTAFFRTKTLRYSELISFQFGATRHYHNGAYTGTSMNMTFTPGAGAEAIAHSQTVRGNDTDLDSLREQVSAMVSRHLLERLSRGEEVQWGTHARFTPAGLVVRESKLFGKGAERLAAYDEGLRYRIADGSFHLFIGDEKKSAMTLECGADNFYPGLDPQRPVLARDARRVPGHGVVNRARKRRTHVPSGEPPGVSSSSSARRASRVPPGACRTRVLKR